MGRRRVRLAVLLGDCRGIGPEIAAKAARALAPEPDRPHLVFVGPAGTGAESAADEFVAVGRWEAGATPAQAGALAGQATFASTSLARMAGGDYLKIRCEPIRDIARSE